MASKILNSKRLKCFKYFLNTKQETVQYIQCSNHLPSHGLLVRNMCMINKTGFYAIVVIYGLLGGVIW